MHECLELSVTNWTCSLPLTTALIHMTLWEPILVGITTEPRNTLPPRVPSYEGFNHKNCCWNVMNCKSNEIRTLRPEKAEPSIVTTMITICLFAWMTHHISKLHSNDRWNICYIHCVSVFPSHLNALYFNFLACEVSYISFYNYLKHELTSQVLSNNCFNPSQKTKSNMHK
jgi:hypothetical protein